MDVIAFLPMKPVPDRRCSRFGCGGRSWALQFSARVVLSSLVRNLTAGELWPICRKRVARRQKPTLWRKLQLLLCQQELLPTCWFCGSHGWGGKCIWVALKPCCPEISAFVGGRLCKGNAEQLETVL